MSELMPLFVLNHQDLLIWCLVTAALAFASRRPLRNPRCHGFYRFFAFVACAGIVIPNLRVWTDDLFAPRQVISWIILFAALGLVLSGLFLLLRRGGQRSQGPRENFTFENTAMLVASGIFGLIRHPMYSGLILFAWGAWFKQSSWLGLSLCLITTFFIWITARIEESENLQVFGANYDAYMARTKRFIPYLF